MEYDSLKLVYSGLAMRIFLRKLFVFALAVLGLCGSFQLASELFLLGRQDPKLAWMRRALDQIHFKVRDASVFQSRAFVPALEGRAREEISRFLKVDVNRASFEELVSLPRVGPAIARRIIEAREHFGPFADLEDLGRVKGLGPKSLVMLRDWVRFEEGSRQS